MDRRLAFLFVIFLHIALSKLTNQSVLPKLNSSVNQTSRGNFNSAAAVTPSILQKRNLILNHLNDLQEQFLTDSQLEKRAKLWPMEESVDVDEMNDAGFPPGAVAVWSNGTETAEALKFNTNRSSEQGDDELEDDDEAASTTSAAETPRCATDGRFYCTHQEDYPTEIVSRIIKYYRYPLKSMFKQLKNQVMPTLAEDNNSGLVCESQTRLLRVGWAMNTDNRWLVVLNTDHYQQYVTEVVCKNARESCNYVPPCYKSKCLQRFNTQKLLVIDPVVPHRGPFLSEFLFPSCCVCHIPASTAKLI